MLCYEVCPRRHFAFRCPRRSYQVVELRTYSTLGSLQKMAICRCQGVGGIEVLRHLGRRDVQGTLHKGGYLLFRRRTTTRKGLLDLGRRIFPYRYLTAYGCTDYHALRPANLQGGLDVLAEEGGLDSHLVRLVMLKDFHYPLIYPSKFHIDVARLPKVYHTHSKQTGGRGTGGYQSVTEDVRPRVDAKDYPAVKFSFWGFHTAKIQKKTPSGEIKRRFFVAIRRKERIFALKILYFSQKTMFKQRIFSLCMLAAAVIAAQAQAVIKFERTSHDYGQFTEDKVQTCVFKFKNTGDQPLVIHQAFASCGCTVPTFSKEPIAPGKSGQIKVEYNGKNKLPGHFKKSVSVRSNASNALVRLYVEGEMVEGK